MSGSMQYSFIAYPELPESFQLENRLAQLDRMKKLDMNPIDGWNPPGKKYY